MDSMEQVLQQNVDCSVQALASIKRQLIYTSTHDLTTFATDRLVQITSFIEQTMKGQLLDTGEQLHQIIKQMNDIMKVLDPADFEKKQEATPGFFHKLFNRQNEQMNSIQKYDHVGAQLQKVYIAVIQYSKKLEQQNIALQNTFDENQRYYTFLVQHEQAIIERIIEIQRQKYYKQYELEKTELNTQQEMLELRVKDFSTVRMISVQLATQLYQLSENNDNVVAKLQTGIIYTIPIFRQLIAQALHQHREQLINQALHQLVDKEEWRKVENLTRSSLEQLDQLQKKRIKAVQTTQF